MWRKKGGEWKGMGSLSNLSHSEALQGIDSPRYVLPSHQGIAKVAWCPITWSIQHVSLHASVTVWHGPFKFNVKSLAKPPSAAASILLHSKNIFGA